jgi:ubiquinone/menaquinone biosynthesis C-methylase UbiE
MATEPTAAALTAAENYQRRYVPYSCDPLAGLLLDHAMVRPGERVVDVGCGTGAVAHQAAPRVGREGAVVAVDINPAMLAVGRSLPAPDGAVIEWREGSAMALRLPDTAFDLALCQHGLQYFSDRGAALREMRRVLAPDGRAAVCVWRSLEHNPLSRLLQESVARRLNSTPLALFPATALGDADELREMLVSAGFGDVSMVQQPLTVREPWDDALVQKSLKAAAAVLPMYAAMTPEELATLAQATQDEIGPALQAFRQDADLVYPMSAHIAVGWKSAGVLNALD